MLAFLLIPYTLLFTALLFTVCYPAFRKYYILAKTAVSLAFVAILLISGCSFGSIHQLFLMLPAFLSCFAGDIMMACYNVRRKKAHFLLGLFLFLTGHVCFVRWLCRMQRLSSADFVFPVLAVLSAFFLTSMKEMHTGKVRPYILFYAFFVALLFAKGVHLLADGVSVHHLFIAVGGTLFLLSDISLLFLYFVKESGKGIHIFNLAAYYYGIFLLAASLLFS